MPTLQLYDNQLHTYLYTFNRCALSFYKIDRIPPFDIRYSSVLRFAFLYVPSFDILRFSFPMYCNHRDIIKLGGITDMIEYVFFDLLDLLGGCCGRLFQKG